ncbi:MAG: phosphatase PAP2 family protein [Sedimentisphaerales bacterium]|nr:phosphatase PAP2 family protein [Sedimentisphaerales bacterium]
MSRESPTTTSNRRREPGDWRPEAGDVYSLQPPAYSLVTHLRAVLPVLALALSLTAGCGTLANGRGWGQDAIWPIDGERVLHAARDALFSPSTLVPLAGALVFQIDGLDRRVSDWAREHTPIFGSEAGAQDASDYLRNALLLESVLAPLATPSGDTPGQWLPAKAKGYAVELAGMGVTGGVTELLKDAAARERPNGANDSSFPSGHTSAAFSGVTLANRNFKSIDGLEPVRGVLDVANTVLAAGVGWARVEAGKHYPSDVLVGAALGYFLTAFIHDAFMNLPEDGHVDLTVVPTEDGATLGVAFRF